MVEPVSLEGPARPLARAFPDPADEDPEALQRPEALQARLQRFLPKAGDYEIVGSNLYTVHQRVAKKFRVGRAILAGDSAHVNSPIGAMGMNSGIHDAFNLADKLVAHPARGGRRQTRTRPLRAPAPPRRACSTRRRETIRNKRLLAEQDPAVRQKNHDQLRRTAEDPKLARAFLLRSSLIESLREAEQIL